MTSINWASAISGDFSTAGNWTGGVVPGANDDAFLDATGSPYTVTVSQATQVGSINVAAIAILSITNDVLGTLDVLPIQNGSQSANAGTIEIGNGSQFEVGGFFDNGGAILLDSTGHPTNLLVNDALEFYGGGKIKLSDNAENLIGGEAGSLSTLINLGNNISGAGEIGGLFLNVINEAGGTIKASGVNPLIMVSPDGITNAGLLKATGAGGLDLSGTINNGATGLIKAKTGSVVVLASAVVEGGTLATAGSGVIQTLYGGGTLDGAEFAVRNTGALQVTDGTTLTLIGAIDNTGTIELGTGPSGANLTLANNVTLTGGGQVTLSDSSGNVVAGEGALSLDNVDNTISGSGQLGDGQLVLTNGPGGVINATGATNSLVVNTGSNPITNNGLMEATGSGVLVIDNAVFNSGTIEANGGTVVINAGVFGAEDTSGSDGTVEIAAGNLVLGNGPLQNTNFLGFTGPTGVLTLLDSQNFAPDVTGFSLSGGTSLDLRDIGFVSPTEATFSGTLAGGTLTVTDGTHTAHIPMTGDFLASTFVASSDGQGGVIVTDPPKTSGFVAAMASMGASAAATVPIGVHPMAAPEGVIAVRLGTMA